MSNQVEQKTEIDVCWLCSGANVLIEADQTGENVFERPCPECMLDPEPEDV